MFSFLFKGKSTNFSYVKIGEIINHYHKPYCHKVINKERINYLSNKFINNFDPITPLYFCVYKHKRYIIDGAHRLECYKDNKYLHDYQIPIIDIFVKNEEDIYKYFMIINDQQK